MTFPRSNYKMNVLTMSLNLRDLKSKDVGIFSCGATILETPLVVPDITVSLTG